MPRIRSIKPEHWSDKNLPKISLGAHLLWISMWNFSDDRGVIECDYQLIKSNSFPRRKEIKPSNIKKWVAELIKQNYVIPFEHNEIQYLIHRTFDVHQKIDKPQKSKINDDVIRRAFAEHSPNDSRTVSDDSDSIRLKDRIGLDSKGKDSIPLGLDLENKTPVYKMFKVWEKEKPQYPKDEEKDFHALLKIETFIKSQTNRNEIESTLVYWKDVSVFVSSHNFFRNYSLTQIEKHIQSISQEMKNGNVKKVQNKGFIDIPKDLNYKKQQGWAKQ